MQENIPINTSNSYLDKRTEKLQLSYTYVVAHFKDRTHQ